MMLYIYIYTRVYHHYYITIVILQVTPEKVIRWVRHVAVILEAVRCRMRCSRSSVAANEKRRHLTAGRFLVVSGGRSHRRFIEDI